MSPLVDAGAVVADDSDLPRAVSWLELTDPRLGDDPMAVIERWQESTSILTGPAAQGARRLGTLRAVVGAAAGEPHALDLRLHGPHALLGGTTGAGKSELLQTWILAMAAAHSPQRVTFLLVDYKGGSAFRECVQLPHTVGLVTDLNPHLVRRALVSLGAELTYREQLFARKRVKDLQEMEKTGDPDTPPSLVIVVDEFAALVHEVPEFVDGMVNVAQRGRSLGLHLILATQRPAGVIKDNLRANTNLRLALRMADETDSLDVLGSPEAVHIDPELPGRAVSKTGPGGWCPSRPAMWAAGLPLASGTRTCRSRNWSSVRAGYGGPWTRPPPPRAPSTIPPTSSASPRPSGRPAQWPSCRRRAAPGSTSSRTPTTWPGCPRTAVMTSWSSAWWTSRNISARRSPRSILTGTATWRSSAPEARASPRRCARSPSPPRSPRAAGRARSTAWTSARGAWRCSTSSRTSARSSPATSATGCAACCAC